MVQRISSEGQTQRAHTGQTPPPDGVLAGEDVPQGSEPDNYDEGLIKRVMGALAARGVYSDMGQKELREAAVEFIRNHNLSTGGL